MCYDIVIRQFIGFLQSWRWPDKVEDIYSLIIAQRIGDLKENSRVGSTNREGKRTQRKWRTLPTKFTALPAGSFRVNLT